MPYINFKNTFDRTPKVLIEKNNQIVTGYPSITTVLSKHQEVRILAIETYPGVHKEEILKHLIHQLNPNHIIDAETIFIDDFAFESFFKSYITDSRVFGRLYMGTFEDIIDEKRLVEVRNQIKNMSGLIVIYGVGASLIADQDLLIYADLARWEIQKRFRNGQPNWKTNNPDEDKLRKFKRGYFVEWRMADRLKKKLFDKIDYLLDTNISNTPKLLLGEHYRKGLAQTVNQPFRLVPYYDAGVWGGQWMKEVCDLDKNQENYAWSFDGVPEENSLYLQYGSEHIEIPAINVVLYKPVELLGNKVYHQYGAEFPIRFDFLDTMGGQNLSLQVHPSKAYIKENFGMKFTQDESYYILDCKPDARVYLGLKNDIDPKEMIDELIQANQQGTIFPDEKFINQFPVKKHDHISIPAGTVHCSGTDTMVLEISSTPYIFTFKLWDWDRVGLDGIPRPINIEHGIKNINWDWNTDWVNKHLMNQIDIIEENDDIIIEKTGLHDLEPIETLRYTSNKKMFHNSHGTVSVLNLVEGKEAIVESPTDAFPPMIIHYAETFIVPAHVGSYTITPYGRSQGQTIKLIKAFIRQ